MPQYDGYYFYIGDWNKIDYVYLHNNRYWPKYNSIIEDTGLPISMQPDTFPENWYCSIAGRVEEFYDTSGFNGKAENLFIYVQDEETKNRILKNVSNYTKKIIMGNVEFYRWEQKGKTKDYGIILYYDKYAVMTGGQRIRIGEIGIMVALLVIEIIVFLTLAYCFTRWMDVEQEENITERQLALYDAMKYYEKVELPNGYLFIFANGSRYFYDKNTGEIKQLEEGASWGDLTDLVNKSQQQQTNWQSMITTIVYAVIVIAIVVGILFALKAFAERKRG